MKYLKSLIFIFCLNFCFYITSAQSLERFVISSGGDFYEQSFLSLSQTIGELPIVDEYISSGLVFSNGFQFADEKNEVINFENIYPVPATDHIYIEYSDSTINNLKIFDAIGKLILVRDVIPHFKNILDVYNMATGVYIVVLLNDKKIVARRKVIVLNN